MIEIAKIGIPRALNRSEEIIIHDALFIKKCSIIVRNLQLNRIRLFIQQEEKSERRAG